MFLLYCLVHHKSLVNQWLEHPTGVQEVIGSYPVGNLDFFFVPGSWHDEHYFFLMPLLCQLKSKIFRVPSALLNKSPTMYMY